MFIILAFISTFLSESPVNYSFLYDHRFVVFISGFFSFSKWYRIFLSVFAKIKFETTSSSVVMLWWLHSFSISTSVRQNSSGASVSVCLFQKNCPRL